MHGQWAPAASKALDRDCPACNGTGIHRSLGVSSPQESACALTQIAEVEYGMIGIPVSVCVFLSSRPRLPLVLYMADRSMARPQGHISPP